MNESIIQQFADLFAGRDDAAGVWDHATDQTYTRREDVTRATYKAHLDGRRSLGVFPLSNDGTVRWMAFDVDTGDFDLTLRIYRTLRDLGLDAWIETSKSKGYHVWVFFSEPTPAVACRRLATAVLTLAKGPLGMEVFPKQTTLVQGQIGNFINLPYWGGPKGVSESKRVFVDEELVPVAIEEFLRTVDPRPMPDQFLRRIDQFSLETVKPSVEPIVPNETFLVGRERGTYDGPTPECIKHALSIDLVEGDGRNEIAARLVGYFHGMAGKDADEVAETMTEWNDGLSQSLTSRELKDVIRKVTKGNYTWGCNRLRQNPVFADGCNWQKCGLYKESEDERMHPEKALIPLEDIEVPQQEEPAISFRDEREMANVIGESGWLKSYIDYASVTTAAPRILHAFTGLAVLAGVMGNRVSIATYGAGRTYANLYVCIVCPSGWFHKSTATGIGLRLVKDQAPDVLLPEEMTPESLTTYLSKETHGQGLWFIDELGSAMSGWQKREYLGGMKGKLTSYFDNRPTSKFIKGNRGAGEQEELDNIALTLIGTTTVDWLQDVMKMEDLRAGFTARMLWVWGETKEQEPDRLDLIPSMPEGIKVFIYRLPSIGTADEPHAADFSGIEVLYQEWLRAFQVQAETEQGLTPEISGVISRAGTYVRKLATIFAVSDLYDPADIERFDPKTDAVVVTEKHLDRAVQIVDWCLARQRHLIRETFQFSDFDKSKKVLMDEVKRGGGLVTYQHAIKVMRREKDKTDKLINTLRASGELFKGKVVTGQRGRPKIFVCWPQAWPEGAEQVA